MGNKNAKGSDLENYRKCYPDLVDDESITDNYRFYSGQIPFHKGDYIDNIHKNWWGKTDILEDSHGYLQWLFPIREQDNNSHSKPLQKHEITKIKDDPRCMQRFRKSYEMMLDFYGCKLKDPTTGEIERHDGWKSRYKNLNSRSHNHVRITRILKSLGELGYEHYKKPFLEHFISEIWEKKRASKL